MTPAIEQNPYIDPRRKRGVCSLTEEQQKLRTAAFLQAIRDEHGGNVLVVIGKSGLPRDPLSVCLVKDSGNFSIVKQGWHGGRMDVALVDPTSGQIVDAHSYQRDAHGESVVPEELTRFPKLGAAWDTYGALVHIGAFFANNNQNLNDALVQVLDGKVELTIGGKAVEANPGEMDLMPANVPHSVRAIERFKMMLTMLRR